MFEKSSAGNRSSSRDANCHQYRQALRYRPDRCSLGADRADVTGSPTRRPTTHNQHSRCVKRNLLSTANRLPMAFASPRVSSVEHCLSLLPSLKNGGVWTGVQRSMYQQARRQAGRTACPSVVIMDGQSVKTTERGGIRGFDAHKRVKGRKRHILVDTFGLLIACRVEPADISDRRAAALLLGGLGALFPNIRTVIADAGHQSRKLAQHLLQQDGWKLQIVKRRKRAFKITGLTWIVERSFAWLGRNRRLSKDYEYSVQTSETLIDIASTDPGKLRVSFPPERYVLFGVIHSHRVLHRDIESAAGGEIRIGKNWRRLLGENDGSTGLLRFGDFRLRAELALANGLRLS